MSAGVGRGDQAEAHHAIDTGGAWVTSRASACGVMAHTRVSTQRDKSKQINGWRMRGFKFMDRRTFVCVAPAALALLGQVACTSVPVPSVVSPTVTSAHFGAIVGRYGNRNARGIFTLDGTTYRLAVNNGPNSLHGGLRGFDKVVWSARPFQNQEGSGVALDYTSPDTEEGYPGTLRSHVTYTLTEDDRLIVDYQATSDKATPVNLTQHSYWNLAGSARRDVLGHELTINADSMTPVDSTLITTGEISSVTGTPFDFRTPVTIGARVDQRQNAQIRYGNGYDHNFVLNRGSAAADALVRAAHVVEPSTGRTMDIL